MTFEVAILGNFPDIPELKLSLPFLVVWRCKYVRLAELLFLYFLGLKRYAPLTIRYESRYLPHDSIFSVRYI